MASRHQIRGALLEETILSLLEQVGYQTVLHPGGDPTLLAGGAGLEVRGRGTTHQIDAIADFTLGQPFANPQRLLVEAKAFDGGTRVGLNYVRNAVGVLKDVSEYWGGQNARGSSRNRYHYQYALFSTTEFTKNAQYYAFAQDVYLVPLEHSAFFAPVVRALYAVTDGLPINARGQVTIPLRRLRSGLRALLRPGQAVLGRVDGDRLRPLADAVRTVGRGLLGTAARGFPLFLVPARPEVLDQLTPVVSVRIRRRENTWYLEQDLTNETLFSFDLPEELFSLYAEEGVLSPDRAVDLKAEYLNEIQAVYLRGNDLALVTFRLNPVWLGEIRNQLRRPR